MKFIHTSDWHLGHNLFQRSRQNEHQKFLDWLITEIRSREIELLIVAGDIFDCGNPPGYAQKMYFDFLCQLAASPCKHAFILGGNHDSPSFLDSSKAILGHLNIYVRGKIDDCLENMVLLPGAEEPLAIVCAVPFLRDRDVRKSVVGESYEEKGIALNKGIADYYRKLSEHVQNMQKQFAKPLPVIATGHLFAAGCVASESVREYTVGNLGAIHGSELDNLFDYVALGHLHICQKVGGNDKIRYCGSPIPMSFDEIARPKFVLAGEFSPELKIEEVQVPVFQKMRLLRGDFEAIKQELDAIVAEFANQSCWLEVKCVEERDIPLLAQTLNEKIENSGVEILAAKSERKLKPELTLSRMQVKSLQELEPEVVFNKRLENEPDYSEEDLYELRSAFNELMQQLYSGDSE